MHQLLQRVIRLKKGIGEVPRSADYEYEYVWVSRILTR